MRKERKKEKRKKIIVTDAKYEKEAIITCNENNDNNDNDKPR